ncbi:NRDE family protein [Montanilutibacter psychrotolerans]|uniref:NRDE family protein n=1 Tax=Montanilutibacter psychrotolerans TaxID=1327343 RepID=A0A3M8SVA3_9GAMM|nr:NRDE family protein [Lysobacter psychrotolerans]RNF85257.1 NRDE family protein [Lysobacter psychrotolerans]
MCLIALAWQSHPRYRLAVIANRDEFHERPAAAAGVLPDLPHLYGGRDLLQGGSWLLVSNTGRLAAVTNVRAGSAGEVAPRSRGALVRDFAASDADNDGFFAALADTAHEYGRFNLLGWDGNQLGFASNHPGFTHAPVAPGVHAMSNGAFDAPWPKSGHATRALSNWLQSPAADVDVDDTALAPLFAALADITVAPDDALPDTGVGLELERRLSPPFVHGDRYGTRCSTVVLVEADRIVFAERRFGPQASPMGQSVVTLPITPWL